MPLCMPYLLTIWEYAIMNVWARPYAICPYGHILICMPMGITIILCHMPTIRGPFRTKNPKNLKRNGQYENCSHSCEVFWKISKKCSKDKFKPCSHIESNTTNPNTIFKLTIYYTKHTNNAKTLSKCWKSSESSEINQTFHIFILLNL